MIGGKLVKVGEPDRLTSSDFGEAIGPKTAAIFYVVAYNEEAANSTEEDPASVPAVAEVARGAGVPLVVDAAAELPPTSNFRRFLDEGADLVVFSGGKAIRGPQSTGLVVGPARPSPGMRAKPQSELGDRSGQQSWQGRDRRGSEGCGAIRRTRRGCRVGGMEPDV